jgi:hypothetical protein
MKLPPLLLLAACFSSLCSANSGAAYVWAWGDNTYGQTNVPAGLTNVVAISVGFWHDLALSGDGTVVAWGQNGEQQTNVPPNLEKVVAIAAGVAHSLALKADGTVEAWGGNFSGECNVPSNLVGVVQVSAGGHSLALKGDGTVVGWGTTLVPSGLSNVTAVSAGQGHSLALKANGTVVAWGDNTYGQCDVPKNLTNGIAVSAGGAHSLVLTAHRTVLAWGQNAMGECNVPVGLTNVVAVAAGADVSAALKGDGTVSIWGAQGYDVGPPAGLSGVTAVSVNAFPPSFLALVGAPQGKPFILFIAPLQQTVQAGSQAVFSVGATGLAPLSYQWYFGSNAIAGATNKLMIINNVSGPGAYSVVITNAEGSATSQTVSLSVIPAIDINMVPAITLKGSAGWTYRIDYLNAVGPTNAWGTLATVTLTNSPEFYFDTLAIGQPARLYRLVQLP